METFITFKPLDGTFVVNSEFGERYKPITTGGCQTATQLHSGIDLRTTHIKTNGIVPVFNTHKGQVIKAGWSDNNGNFIVLKDASGKATIYSHLHEIRFTVDGTEHLFGKNAVTTSVCVEGVCTDQESWLYARNYITEGKVYLNGVEQVGKEVSFTSRTQMATAGQSPNNAQTKPCLEDKPCFEGNKINQLKVA